MHFAELESGWFRFRRPDTADDLWALVADEAAQDRTLTLITNVPLDNITTARTVYEHRRLAC